MSMRPLRSLDELQAGAIVRHRRTGDAYIVVGFEPGVAIAVRQVSVCNAGEWLVWEEEKTASGEAAGGKPAR